MGVITALDITPSFIARLSWSTWVFWFGVGGILFLGCIATCVAQRKFSRQASADSFRSLLKTAVKEAEQLAASIKMKAQAEAEAEARRIINQAKEEAEKIKEAEQLAAKEKAKREAKEARKAKEAEKRTKKKEAEQLAASIKMKAQAEAEARRIINQAKEEAEKIKEAEQLAVKEKAEREAKEARRAKEAEKIKGAEQLIARKETGKEIEQPVQLQEEVSEEKTEQPVRLQEEATVSVPAEELLEQHPPEGITDEEANSTQLEPIDSQTLYTGEVELAIAIPVELRMVSKFYNHLQTIPDIKILRTTGSWDRGTTITVVADKPISLISEILKAPGVKVIPELLQPDSSVKGVARLRQRAGGKGVKRIKLTLKEA